MKQRITYILPSGTGLSASDIDVQHDSLSFGKAGLAVEEWRFTLGLRELPDELRTFLEDTHELHMRWTSERNARSLPPLVSRVPPGLHMFFTPRSETQDVSLCRLLERLLQPEKAKCRSVAESFSKPRILSGRFAQISTWQWFQLASLRHEAGQWILSKVCDEAGADGVTAADSCRGRLDAVSSASYVDVDFDAISHALTLTAVWTPYIAGVNVSSLQHVEARRIAKARQDDRVEVGTLEVEQSDEEEELSLGGFLTVIGDDDGPSATMFSFPSRHHPLPASSRSSYTAAFQQPTGLHPKLEILLSRQNLKPPKDSCALHAYWTLPSAVFIDRYQFSDPLFLASQNLIALHSLSGEDDLEAPDWVIDRWGSAVLLELAHPLTSTGDDTNLKVIIPTHLRYLTASQNDTSGQTTLRIPWPSIFWACEAEEGLKTSNNPFDRINLGFDGLFGPKTMFYHIPPASDAERLVSEIQVPVQNPGSAGYVRFGTALAVLLGFGWVCWKMIRNVRVGLQPKVGEEKKARPKLIGRRQGKHWKGSTARLGPALDPRATYKDPQGKRPQYKYKFTKEPTVQIVCIYIFFHPQTKGLTLKQIDVAFKDQIFAHALKDSVGAKTHEKEVGVDAVKRK